MRILQSKSQTQILISENRGPFIPYARRFDDYNEAKSFAEDIQVQTKCLIHIKLEPITVYYLDLTEEEKEAEFQNYIETHPGVAASRHSAADE